jgi:hypothetical protein
MHHESRVTKVQNVIYLQNIDYILSMSPPSYQHLRDTLLIPINWPFEQTIERHYPRRVQHSGTARLVRTIILVGACVLELTLVVQSSCFCKYYDA